MVNGEEAQQVELQGIELQSGEIQGAGELHISGLQGTTLHGPVPTVALGGITDDPILSTSMVEELQGANDLVYSTTTSHHATSQAVGIQPHGQHGGKQANFRIQTRRDAEWSPTDYVLPNQQEQEINHEEKNGVSERSPEEQIQGKRLEEAVLCVEELPKQEEEKLLVEVSEGGIITVMLADTTGRVFIFVKLKL